jgi:ABC-type dipeptide/oligopeptide/nickel transport system permease subunit
MTGPDRAPTRMLAGPARPAARAWRRGLRQRLRRFARRRLVVVGAALVALEVLLAVLAPGLAPYPPNAQNFMRALQPPGTAHWLGTDDLGRDILSRLLFGSRISLQVGMVAVLLAVAVGLPLGLVVGYVGGRLDEVVMRIVDGLMSLPPLVLALTITAVLGSGIQNAMIAIAVVSIPTYARLMRGQVLSVRENDYIGAIVAAGAATPRILFRHVLPNSIQPIIVQGSLGVGFAIITESSLSFIGLGARPPTATWGSMVQVGFQYLEIAPWFVLAPAVMIFIAVLGFNVLGDGLRDALDPSLRR